MQTSYDAGKKKRYAAWSLLAGFLFAVLLSLTFCAEEVDHFCTGGTLCDLRTVESLRKRFAYEQRQFKRRKAGRNPAFFRGSDLFASTADCFGADTYPIESQALRLSSDRPCHCYQMIGEL